MDGYGFSSRRVVLGLLATALAGLVLQAPFSEATAGRKHRHKNRKKLDRSCTTSKINDRCIQICCPGQECSVICDDEIG